MAANQVGIFTPLGWIGIEIALRELVSLIPARPDLAHQEDVNEKRALDCIFLSHSFTKLAPDARETAYLCSDISNPLVIVSFTVIAFNGLLRSVTGVDTSDLNVRLRLHMSYCRDEVRISETRVFYRGVAPLCALAA